VQHGQTEQPSSGNSLPQDRSEYAGVSLRFKVGIMAFDQSFRWDSLLAPTTSSFFAKALSPRRDKLALAYQTTDSLKVCLITFDPIKLTTVNSMGKALSVAFAWNTDDSILYFNYYGLKRMGNRSYTQNLGSYYLDANSMQLHYLKFSNGSVIEGYLPQGFLVTSYGDATYLINLRTGRPSHVLRGRNGLTFSPNGKWFFYFDDRTFLNEYGNEVKIPELYLADFRGTHRKRIVDYAYRPQNPVWSPDSRTIALDVQSQKWSNIRDLAFYDVGTGFLSVQSSTQQVNVPSTTEPHYSPDGRYLFYYVTVGDLSVYPYWEEIDAVVKDLRFGLTQVISRGSVPGNPTGGFIQWFDDNNLALSATGWLTVFNVAKGTQTTFNDYPLYIWQTN
jgi:hypothetical protein